MRKSFHYLYLLLFVNAIAARDLSTSIYGRLVCNGKPAVNVRLRLYDKRLFGDKQIYETDSNQNGEFRLFGFIDTFFKFEPYVRLYHRCNYNGFCSRTITFNVPSQFITNNSIPAVTFDTGTLNLNAPSNNETLVCGQKF